MPMLPDVRSRQCRVRGQNPQAAGALIPDNTQHSWRDDVGRGTGPIYRGRWYGTGLRYAGPMALKDMFDGGHYGTVKAHADRWQALVKWCRSEDGPGVNDARRIDRQVLADYAAHVRGQVERGELAVSTGQNRISSVNRTMAALRGD